MQADIDPFKNGSKNFSGLYKTDAVVFVAIGLGFVRVPDKSYAVFSK
jgi:hypothetical protein